MIISGQILQFEVSIESYSGLLIINIKYVNKQTNNIYINKQTTGKAKLKPRSIKNLFNITWIEFSLSCCLFVYIYIVFCLFTYFTSIISRPEYNSTDTSNSNICPLMIILWQNIYFYT